jgi:AmiR/NasT family two-component response regulator
MKAPRETPSFEGWNALVVHRPHPNVDAIMQQFERIGIAASHCWPEATHLPDLGACNVLLIDADMGYDGQFPWEPGQAPMPIIALIGSEAPGRIAWAMSQGADAQLLKPIGSAGLYGALVIACHSFAERRAMTAEIAALRRRLESREVLAEATALLMVRDNISARAAYQKLRLAAMGARQPIEAAAADLVFVLNALGKSDERA